MNISDSVIEVARKQAEKVDEIIRVSAEQGYNYLILTHEMNYENDKVTMKLNYRAVHNKDEIPDGMKCEVYDLSNVKEYLISQRANTEES